VIEADNTRTAPLGVFARFILLGAGSLALNLIIVTCLCEIMDVPEGIAGGIGYAIVLVVNFTLARRYVFESKAAIVPEAARFSIVQVITRLGEYGAFLALTYLAQVHYFAAIVIVGIVFFAIKFVVYRLLVFRADRVREP
jgi:putative flippase GtrA